MTLKKQQNLKPLTAAEKESIASFWKQFNKKATKLYSNEQYAVYNKYRKDNEHLTDYIPDDFYYCYADTYFTNYHTSVKVDNKNMYDLYFHDVKRPESIVRKMNGILMDSNYHTVTRAEAIDLCTSHGGIIVKQAIDSDGGHGVRVMDNCKNAQGSLAEILENDDNFIIQSLIRQHPVLAAFNPQSVNTIRIMTLIFKGKTTVLSSVLRMGINGARVDNASSGGIVCGISPDGSLKDKAFDAAANMYQKHPQGKEFKGVVIPSYSRCVALAKELAPRFSNYTRLISWDFSIDEQGLPLLIEANLTGGQLDFHQLCNGPIWGSLTKDILTEIISRSEDVKRRISFF